MLRHFRAQIETVGVRQHYESSVVFWLAKSHRAASPRQTRKRKKEPRPKPGFRSIALARLYWVCCAGASPVWACWAGGGFIAHSLVHRSLNSTPS